MELEKYTTEQLNQCAFLSNIMSRMVKGLRFYTTCKLPSEPATVSWIHQETENPGAETKELVARGTARSLHFMFLFYLSLTSHEDSVVCIAVEKPWA